MDRMSLVVPQASSGSLWDQISKIVSDEGVILFDMDVPGGGEEPTRGGVLRVYITRPKINVGEAALEESQVSAEDADDSVQRGGVSFEDCVRVSKRILDIDEETGLIPDGCLLEVSSPGVNRRLRRREHFEGAIGERVKLKFRAPNNVYRVVTGVVTAVDGDSISMAVEGQEEVVTTSIHDVKDARVDFKF